MGFNPYGGRRPPPAKAQARRRSDRLFVAAGLVAVTVLLLWAFLGGI